jgi:hypothetical protein
VQDGKMMLTIYILLSTSEAISAWPVLAALVFHPASVKPPAGSHPSLPHGNPPRTRVIEAVGEATSPFVPCGETQAGLRRAGPCTLGHMEVS